jgi:hypothetical protein
VFERKALRKICEPKKDEINALLYHNKEIHVSSRGLLGCDAV